LSGFTVVSRGDSFLRVLFLDVIEVVLPAPALSMGYPKIIIEL
jgi:hypothetical protein